MTLPSVLLASALAAASIDAALWHERLLVVFATSRNSPMLMRQLAVDGPETQARNVRLILVVGDEVGGATENAATLRRRFGAKPGEFRVVLVGKDGRVKLDEREPISVQRLSATIDAMPMRKDEMRH